MRFVKREYDYDGTLGTCIGSKPIDGFLKLVQIIPSLEIIQARDMNGIIMTMSERR